MTSIEPVPQAKPRRPWLTSLAAILTACAAMATLDGLGAPRAAAQRAPHTAAPVDSFRVFESDLGPAWIDVGAYPPEQQKSYALFSQKCSKCHTLARPINSALNPDQWNAYVSRMSRKPGSNISPKDAEVIERFLAFDTQRRARTAGSVDPELLPFLKVSQELSGVRRFPASKRDIRAEDGTMRVAVVADPRLDLSQFFATDAGEKLVKWTRREPNKGEIMMQVLPSLPDKPPPSAPPTADAALKKAATEAIGDATDPRERVERILDWLDEKIKKEYRAGLGEPAAILADRRGDATEFTRLFVAMARAASVPARTRIGLVARRTGFFFHPWADVWIGGWVPVDPYLGQLPADATHVRLAAPGADALSSWDARRVPGLDRLELRVVLPETKAAVKDGG